MLRAVVKEAALARRPVGVGGGVRAAQSAKPVHATRPTTLNLPTTFQ
jgi:hypothetical protein